jgi:superfamily I DNA/RNA helicase
MIKIPPAMASRIAYRWKPLEDLPSDWKSLQSKELEALSRVWAEQRQYLEDKEALASFKERLLREWAIETGIIERLYSLDRAVTQLLIDKGLDAALAFPMGALTAIRTRWWP